MELVFAEQTLYRVKRGQKLAAIARAFNVPPRLLAAENGLSEEPPAGVVLRIPSAGDLYTVRGGESKTLLCGSKERYEGRNRTACLYPAQQIVL